MKSIYKYHLGHEKNMVVKMPKDAKILCLQEMFNECFLFAKIDIDAPLENRFFKSIQTSDEFIDSANEVYIGTYSQGTYFIHVFEVVK